jgi:hypothetical protein
MLVVFDRRFFIEDDEGHLYPTIAGGDKEVGEGDGSEAAVGEEGSENLGEGSDGGEGGKKPPEHVPYSRFQEVNARAKELDATVKKFMALGTPEEIAARLERLKELGAASPYTEKELKEIEDRLMVIPTFRKIVEFVESQSKTSAESSKAFLGSMRQRTATYMKELGLEFKDERQRERAQFMVEGIIAEAIRTDPELLKRWQLSDKSVIDDAIKASQSVLGLLRRNMNAKVQGNKASIKPGAPFQAPKKPAEGEPPKDPRDLEREILDKAAERGFAILQDRES